MLLDEFLVTLTKIQRKQYCVYYNDIKWFSEHLLPKVNEQF